MRLAQLLRCRLIFVTGKGGTGKTSFAAALARLSANRGRRVVIAEVDSHRPALTSVLGRAPAYVPVSVGTNLDASNVTWKEALEEWLYHIIPAKRVVRLVLANRIVQLFLEATPGARETVILSRLVTLLDHYDQVIVDMPASGHALSLLSVPHIAVRLMRTGPVRERSEEVLEVFKDPRTALIVMGLPEEMVVNETIELWQDLRKQVPEVQIPLVALNRCAAPTLTVDEQTLIARLAQADHAEGDEVAELLRAGSWEADLERATAAATERLKAEIGTQVVSFPRLGALGGFDGGPERLVQQMAAALARYELAEQDS